MAKPQKPTGYILQGKYRRQRTPPAVIIGRHDEITPQKIKEAVFNIAASWLHSPPERTIFLDLFAGSGQLGYEAISRNFFYTLFFEINRERCQTIRQWLKEHNEERAYVHKVDVFRSLGKIYKEAPGNETGPYSRLFFADPPYTREGNFEPGAVIRLLQLFEENRNSTNAPPHINNEVLIIQTPSPGSKYYRNMGEKKGEKNGYQGGGEKPLEDQINESCHKVYTYGNHRLLLVR